ncbi:putative LRR receptor-like serine/threonine-protein kinase [Sesamum alatum]|uniref:LRR receptor-like serine/threonine-protein kinase n=1 Tax=Sesamum alatum TaxID=300844 RepID=A0AAE1Y092_9LAMI|nr:putative LRR receptor-like serine/threonine-protein kinase [Sesamum alatum]
MRELKLILSLLFLRVTAAGSSFSLLSPKGVNFEVAALMSVKREMRDENHVLDGWDINSVDPCTWNMVGCSPEGFVISLEMASMGLSGTLSPSIGNLTHLRTMLLQNNQLSGVIPIEIGKLSELQTLDLSSNQFNGEIPSSLGRLTRLSYLRLSKNKLSGQIPRDVADLTGLSVLDLSFNNLSGPIPKILAKDYSVAGNIFLCSSASQICMAVPKPINETSSYTKVSHHHHLVVAIIVGVSCAFVVSILLLICWVQLVQISCSITSYVQQDYEFDIGHLKRFSLRELQIATSNFNPKNILGQGGFGVVYKGILPNKAVVAVKRLKDPSFTGEVQFQTEVEMIGLALHRNLLRLYGFCMTPEEKLLVYPYMPNGSVADRLRDPGQEKPTLDWSKRMHIAVGASRGLLYLHEQCRRLWTLPTFRPRRRNDARLGKWISINTKYRETSSRMNWKRRGTGCKMHSIQSRLRLNVGSVEDLGRNSRHTEQHPEPLDLCQGQTFSFTWNFSDARESRLSLLRHRAFRLDDGFDTV